MNLEIPYLTYSDIRDEALKFLQNYHPSLELPIPIENIIDTKMGLDLVPHNNLYRDFGLSGFLTRDRTAIYYDEHQADHYQEKFRFTLAHEIVHYVLHEQFYENLHFESPDEYIEWRLSVPPEEMSWFETHGDWFAGLVLVPKEQLIKLCYEIVSKYQKIFTKFTKIPEDAWSYISNEIAQSFWVNPPVVEIRIKREKIPEMIPLT